MINKNVFLFGGIIIKTQEIMTQLQDVYLTQEAFDKDLLTIYNVVCR